MRGHDKSLKGLEILEPRQMLSADHQVFDFGRARPLLPVEDAVKVSSDLYDAAVGYGWLDNMRLQVYGPRHFRTTNDDSVMGWGAESVFRIDVPVGEYEVRATLGYGLARRDRMHLAIDGHSLGEVTTTRDNLFTTLTHTTSADDGVIELAFSDLGGNRYWSIASVELTRIVETPPPDPHPGHQEPIPDFATSPTLVAVASGDWSDPGSWDLGRVPAADDVVVIPEHLHLTVNDTEAIADRIVVHGTLQFATDVDTRLRVSTLHVEQHGALIVGTEASPIVANAQIIIRDTPIDLSFDHGKYGTGVVVEGSLQAHGQHDANKNVLFTSENPNGTRGHMMIVGTAQLDSVEIRDLGRTTLDPLGDTNQVGRYAVHIHLAGDKGYSSYVKNSLIYDTLPSVWRHGIAIHGTHGVTVANNTIRNKAGSGIYLEDGTERDNVIEGNLIEDIVGVSSRADSRGMKDLGFEGAGIWMRGPDNHVRNNIVRRSSFGYHYFFMYAPTIAQTTPIREFSGNVAEDCNIGLEYWWIGGYHGDQATGESVLDITARNCQWGVYGYQGGDVRITGTIENCRFGYDGGDYLQRRLTISDMTITGCEIGILPSTVTHEPMRIERTNLDNTIDIQMHTLYHNNDGRRTPPRRVEVIDSEMLGETKIRMRFSDGGVPNYVQRDELIVRSATESYQVFYSEQRPDFVVPQSSSDGRVVGSPEPELTNRESWERHGVAIAGAIAPENATDRAGIIGLVAPLE